MANYTKGPWLGRTVRVSIPRIERCGVTIALTGNGTEENANADLISAAPDLLEALQELVSISEAREIYAGRARAAIKKATGQ